MIFGLVRQRGGLVSSFEQSSKEFSKAWTKARSAASSDSIHSLRVRTRRILARLELSQALTTDPQIEKLHRRFKKVLKRLGPLRDLQVQLDSVSQVWRFEEIWDFKREIKEREQTEASRAEEKLDRGRKRQLDDGFSEVRFSLQILQESLRKRDIQRACERMVSIRLMEFLQASGGLDPVDAESLHRMRIALKRWRYISEAASPVLGESVTAHSHRVRVLQRFMGEARDIELLRRKLAEWAVGNPREASLARACARLEQKRDALIKEVVNASRELHQHLQVEPPTPIVEKTYVPLASAAAANTTIRA